MKFLKATASFIGKAGMQALERAIPHGASELGSVLYTGSAYSPPGVTERLTQDSVYGNETVQAEAVEAVRDTKITIDTDKHPMTADTYYVPQKTYNHFVQKDKEMER